MSQCLEFFFDYRSPYSYLAHSQLGSLNAEVAYRPFEIRQLMDKVGNVPTSIICKPKSRYLGADLQRWVQVYGIPFQRHPHMAEIDARRLLRATLAADEMGRAAPVVAAIFGAFWGAGAPLMTPADVAAVLNGAGVDRPDLALWIDDPALDETLDRATDAAAERGVFGAPTIFIGDDMYFGNDRFHFMRERLARQAVA